MGFNFRKSIKIAPGVKLNISKRGVSSVSVGTKGARVSVSKKGTRTTVGIPGSGLSYSSYKSHGQNSESGSNTSTFKIFFWCAVIFIVLMFILF
ncbi:DUF4236 domain-containing protein [Acinetobacter sp. ANC 4636]